MGLTIANGVAQGVNAFMQSFMQAKQYKQQAKLQKNLPLVEILQRQISDPNTSYYERAKIIDQIPELLGAKTDRPLSAILGYDKLNEQDFQVETKQNAEVGTAKSQTITPQNPIAGQGNVQGDEVVSPEMKLYGTTGQNITKKYGDMTPAQVHNKLQLDLEKARDTNDIDKQTKILKANYTLQSEILNKGGFTKEVSRGYDVDGNFQILMTNGDAVKPMNLGKFTPEALAKAKIMSGGKAGGNSKLGQLMHANSIIDTYNNDPTSISFSDYTGAKQFIEDFEKTGQVKDAQVIGLTQGNTGTKKIQPAQIADDIRANKDREDARQKSYDDTVAQALQTSREAADFATAATQHVNNVIEPLKERIKRYLIDKDENPAAPSAAMDSDADYKSLQSQLNREMSNYNSLKAKADSAAGRDSEAKQKLSDAKSRLGNSSNNVVEDYSKYRKKIEAFKGDNPSTKDYSDAQIVQILRDAKRIK